MLGAILPILIGITCILLGAANRKGNINSLHSYHRHRVTEEDRIPFGRMVGLGTIIIGAGMILFGIFALLAMLLEALIWIGMLFMFISLIAGLIISLSAMLKYNKGIF